MSMETPLSSSKLGMLLDISMFKQKNNDTPTSITQLHAPATLTLDIPADIQKTGRTFSALGVKVGTPPRS